MTQLVPIQLEDGVTIYIEATEGIETPPTNPQEAEEEAVVSKGISPAALQQRTIQSFKAIEGTIRAYTGHALNAFRQVTTANIDKVTLEFGIKIGGEVGIPYVTKGTGESNLKITVECSFLDNTASTQSE